MFTILLINANVALQGMQSSNLTDVGIINLTNHDITLFPYINQKPRDPKHQQKFAAKADFYQGLPKIEHYNQADEWYASATIKEKEVFGEKPSQAINITKIINQQLTQKPWLQTRPILVIIRDASYLGSVARALGYGAAGLDIQIVDENPFENEKLKNDYNKIAVTHTITNDTNDQLDILHYYYDSDGAIYRLKPIRTLQPQKLITQQFIPTDKLYLIKHSGEHSFPMFNLPTDSKLINLTDELANYIEKQPYLDGAKLSINISAAKGNSYCIAIQPKEDSLIALPHGWYDISKLEKRPRIKDYVVRFLFYAQTDEVNAALKKQKIAILYIPDHSNKVTDFWKLSHPTMQALQQFAQKVYKGKQLPVEVIIVKNDKDLAMRLANDVVNKMYSDTNSYKEIITIGEKDGGNVAATMTHYIERPIDAMYQLFAPTRQQDPEKSHQYPPNPEKFIKLYNFYMDQGLGIQNWLANHIPNPANITNYGELSTAWNQMWPLGSGAYLETTAKPKDIFNIAVQYKGYNHNNQIASQVEPLLTHLYDITDLLSKIYSIHTDLQAAIDINDASVSGIYLFINKEPVIKNTNQDAIAQVEKNYSENQKQRLGNKFPASYFEQFATAAQETYTAANTLLGYGKQATAALFEKTKVLYEAAKTQTPGAIETVKEATQAALQKLSTGAQWLAKRIKDVSPESSSEESSKEEIELLEIPQKEQQPIEEGWETLLPNEAQKPSNGKEEK